MKPEKATTGPDRAKSRKRKASLHKKPPAGAGAHHRTAGHDARPMPAGGGPPSRGAPQDCRARCPAHARRRRSAKKKSQDAMFFVKSVARPVPHDIALHHIDHILGNVRRHVGDPFDVLRDGIDP